MYKYLVWVRLDSYRTAHTYVWTDYDFDAKALAEAQYGVGNVLKYTRVD